MALANGGMKRGHCVGKSGTSELTINRWHNFKKESYCVKSLILQREEARLDPTQSERNTKLIHLTHLLRYGFVANTKRAAGKKMYVASPLKDKLIRRSAKEE